MDAGYTIIVVISDSTLIYIYIYNLLPIRFLVVSFSSIVARHPVRVILVRFDRSES